MKGDELPQVPFDAERPEGGDGVESRPKPQSSSRSGASARSEESSGPVGVTAAESGREGPRLSAKPTVVVTVTAIIAAMMFAGAYAAGRSAVKPADTPEYRSLVADVADARRGTEANKDKARKLTAQLESLQEQQRTADAQLNEAKQAYQRYVPEGGAADQPLHVESFDVRIVPNEVGTGTYVHPKFVVRNTSGHVIVKIEIIGDIVKADGTVVDADQSISAYAIRLMPGRTAVIEKDLISAKGSRGDLFKPRHYYCQTYGESQSKDVRFGDDTAAKVIS